jgi:hypothetical protein
VRRRLFAPTARQINVLLVAGFLSLGYALYLRYLAIEQTPVGLACDAGLATWLCFMRRIVSGLFGYDVFGAVAVAAAVLHLWRPSLAAFLIGLVAAGFGVVLYNVGLSALAVGLLILGFARPQTATG